MKPYTLTFRHDGSENYSVILNSRWMLGEFSSFALARVFLVALLSDTELLQKTVEEKPE